MRHSIKDRAGRPFDCALAISIREIHCDDSCAIVAAARIAFQLLPIKSANCEETIRMGSDTLAMKHSATLHNVFDDRQLQFWT